MENRIKFLRLVLLSSLFCRGFSFPITEDLRENAGYNGNENDADQNDQPFGDAYMNAAIHLGTELLDVHRERHEAYQNSRTTATPTVSDKQNLYPPKFSQVFYLINKKPGPEGVITEFEIKDPDNDPNVTFELSSEDANVEFNQESKTVSFKNGFRPTPNKMPYVFQVNATEIKNSVLTGLSTTVPVVVNYAEEQIFNNKMYEIRVPVPISENEEVGNVTFNNPEGYDISFEDGESTFRIVGNAIQAAKDITPEIASSFENGVHYESLIVKGQDGTVISQQHATIIFYFVLPNKTTTTETECPTSAPEMCEGSSTTPQCDWFCSWETIGECEKTMGYMEEHPEEEYNDSLCCLKLKIGNLCSKYFQKYPTPDQKGKGQNFTLEFGNSKAVNASTEFIENGLSPKIVKSNKTTEGHNSTVENATTETQEMGQRPKIGEFDGYLTNKSSGVAVSSLAKITIFLFAISVYCLS